MDADDTAACHMYADDCAREYADEHDDGEPGTWGRLYWGEYARVTSAYVAEFEGITGVT